MWKITSKGLMLFKERLHSGVHENIPTLCHLFDKFKNVNFIPCFDVMICNLNVC